MSEEPRITAQNPTTPGSPRPKRILAIDGGGVRGIVAIGFLERMEAALQDATGNQQLLLADHFDLIGGTSVGSMIATMLALGRPTDRVAATFKEVAPKIFRRQIGEGIFVPQFSARDLEQVLLRELGDMRLDDPKLRTGLAIIIKRLDTGSPWWIMTNNPGGKFWESDGQQTIADLIRASTAAPTVFEPKELPLAVGGPGLFVDGGLTPFNNPSLALLMAAVLKAHGFRWALGQSKLQLISVGTGSWRQLPTRGLKNWFVTALSGVDALRGMIDNNHSLSLALMQWMSEPRLPWAINKEIEDMRGELLSTTGEPLLQFQRYDLALEADDLTPFLNGKPPSPSRLAKLRRMENPAEIETLHQISRKAAQKQVQVSDFL